MATRPAPVHDIPLTPGDAQQLQRAHQALQGGQPQVARQLCQSVLNAKPHQPDAMHLLGLALKAMGDREAALQALQDSLASRPHQPQLLNNLGNLLSDMGRTPEALAAYQQALAQEPRFLDAWINFGLTAMGAGQSAEAVRALRQATTVNPNSPKAWMSLGSAYRKTEQLDEAIAAFRKSLALAPNNGRCWLNLGVSLRLNGEPDAALECLAKAEQMGMSGPELVDGRASVLLDQGQTQDSISLYRQITRASPTYAAAHTALAKLVWEQKLAEDPTTSVRAALRDHPQNVALWQALFGVLLPMERWEETLATVQDARSAMGDLPFLDYVEAMALDASGEAARAAHLFEKTIAALPSDENARASYARHLLRTRKPDAAAQQAEAVARINPDSQFAWAYLGTAWRMLDDPREDWLHDYDRLVMPLDLEVPDGVPDAASFAAMIEAALLPLHRSAQHPLDQSLRGGTQTEGSLFVRKDPMIQTVKRQIEKAIGEYVRRLPDDATHPLLRRKSERVRFTGSWSVRLRGGGGGGGGHHVNHLHSMGWISSAFYVQLPACMDADAQASTAGWIQFGEPPVELGLELPPRRVVRPKVGQLVLFPSYTWHGTVPFEDDDTRTTIAFDAVPA